MFRSLAPGIIIGVMLGVMAASFLTGPSLQIGIGLYAWITSYKMAFGKQPHSSRTLPSSVGLSGWGAGIGSVSGLCGIGGGSLTVPFLFWCNVPMPQAVGTAAACGFPLALFGTATNVWTGWGNSSLPEWSTGYVFWPAVLGVVLMSTPFARVGAKLAHKLPALVLRRSFAAFLFVVGAQMLLPPLLGD
ncbi:MAG: putative membrane protein YfcA [Planctomycetota bacterium]